MAKKENVVENENTKNESIEEKFLRLDEILKQLSAEGASMAQSLDLYKEGMTLVGECNDMIDRVEKQLIILEDA